MTFGSWKEIPFDINDLLEILPQEQPENEYQALMEAPPGCEPSTTKSELAELVDIVRECMEFLLPQDLYIVQAVAYERITYEELGERLGISAPHAWRLKQIAYQHLGEVLVIDGRIKRYLGSDDS